MIYKAMMSASWIGGLMMAEALEGEMPLLFRGCLGAGWMKVEGDFLIGPAVDETASLFEQADGPFFWMSPSALAINDRYADTFGDRIEPGLMIRYPVPLKKGNSIETMVHVYYGVKCPAARWAQTRAAIDAAFGPRPLHRRVKSKYVNTQAFLNRVEEVALHDKEVKSGSVRVPFWEDLTQSQRMQILKRGGPDVISEFPRRDDGGSS
jgi:hypothetical protein